MPDFRKGTAAIEASKNKGSGDFKPFAPSIRWPAKEAGEEKYLLFLTPIEEAPTVLYHEFIPVGKVESKDGKERDKFGFYISRKDPAIGEDFDLLTDEHGIDPKERTFAVAVELEPTFKTVKGRKRPAGFTVKTTEYQRRKGEDDEGTETVVAPVVGIVAQAASNFFAWLATFNEKQAPIEDVPMSVTRVGDDKDTTYAFVPFEDQPVDLSALVENWDGLSYLRESQDELAEAVEGADTDEEAALIIGEVLLDTRLEELADGDLYEEEVGSLEVGQIKTKYGGKRQDSDDEKPARRERRTRTAKKDADEPEADAGDDGDDGDERKKRFDRMRKRQQQKSAA